MAFTIANDYGGSIAIYALAYENLAQRGESVRINGFCMSACTLFFRVGEGQYCATWKASLHFHAGSSPTARAIMMGSYPEKLQDWIDARGSLKDGWITLRPPELYEFVPKCG